MSWFTKFSQEDQPWKMTRKEYTGPYEAGHDDAWSKAYYARQIAWEKATQYAVSMGFLTPEEAKKKGMHFNYAAQPLPDILFHVTTAKDKVMADKLRTRGELEDGFSGLGGGPEDTISLTDDIEVARSIKNAIVEVKKIIESDFDVEAMLEQAEEGRGADRPWIQDVYRMYDRARNDGDNKMPPNLKSLITKEREDIFGIPINEKFLDFHTHGKGSLYTPDESTFGEIDGYGNKTFKRWVRQLTSKELYDGKIEFYKRWVALREYAGGPMNPLFWGDSMKNLPNIPEDQIAIVELQVRPGSIGTQQSALGEWRAWTGDVFETAKVVG